MSSSYASSSLPSHGSAFQRDYRTNPLNNFNEQYSQLQQARMMQQMKTQNDALQRQHQTFAMRQMLNPPLMSRQASAINLHQSHISTQTTSSVQCSPTLNQPSTSMVSVTPFTSNISLHSFDSFIIRSLSSSRSNNRISSKYLVNNHRNNMHHQAIVRIN